MPSLTQGQSVDLTLAGDSTLTIQNPGGYVTVENPIGTVVFGGGGADRKLDLRTGSVRVTATTGGLYYELALDTGINQVNQDNTSGILIQTAGPAGSPSYPASVAAIRPVNDGGTGAAFYDQFNEAMLRAQAAGGGRVDVYPGTYWSKRLTGGETRRLVDNVTLRSPVPRGAIVRCVNDPLVNKSNIIEANNVHNWSIVGFDLDGNRQASQVVAQGDTDALDNCVRVVNCREWQVTDCTLRNARQHGLIGVQSLSGFAMSGLHLTGNGWRGAHIHSEINRMNRRGRIHDIKCYRNGQGGYHGHQCLVSTTNGSAVVQMPAGSGAAMALLFTAAGTSAFVRIPGAGASGGDMIANVSSVNSGANQITITQNCSATLSSVPMAAMGEVNTGLFVVFGGEELHMDSINIWQEYGNGCQFTGYNDAQWQRLGQWYGTVLSSTLDRLRMSPSDYTAFKTAYNALTAPQKALSTITLDMAGPQGSEHVSAITAFNDSDNSVTLTIAASAEVRRGRIDAAWNIGSGGNLRQQSQRIKVDGLIINDCGVGIEVSQCQDIGFSNTHVDRSLIYGAWFKSAQDCAMLPNTSIRRSGVNNIAIQAPADGAQPQSLTDSRMLRFFGSYSDAGASCVRMGNSTNTRVLDTFFLKGSVVEGGGSNAHFRQNTNFLGTTCAVGIRANNDAGSGVCEAPWVFGDVARNHRGGVRTTATAGGGGRNGAHIFDNVDPAAISVGTATGGTGARAWETVGNCGSPVLDGVDFRNRDRINESYTLDLSTGTTAARVQFCDLSTETRNGGGGNVAFGNASTIHYGNTLAAGTTWSGGGVTTIPAV